MSARCIYKEDVTETLRLPSELAGRLVDHARSELPNEACGLLAGRRGEAVRMYPMKNCDASPRSYRMDPKEQLTVFAEIDDAGLELVGIYHSHVRSPAYPSPTDVSLAFYPESVYLIVSFASEPPELKGYRIVDGSISEVALETPSRTSQA